MAFQQGLSGLNATTKSLSVIGNNIANANTYGNKAARAEFSDVYANAMNGSGSNGIGIGVNLTSVVQQFSQGNISTTESNLDLAINGGGFFQLDNNGSTVYSRNGQFQLNKDGYIVNAGGNKLLGYAASTAGTVIPSTVQALKLPTAGVAPHATDLATLELNLDSRQPVTGPGATVPIDFQDPKTFNNATSISVYDDKGQEVALTLYFQKTKIDAVNGDLWDVYATANGQSFPTPLAPVIPGMTFKPDGSGLDLTATPMPFTLPPIPAVALPGGGTSLDIPSTAAQAATPPVTGVLLDLTATSYGSSFSVTNLTQNGYAPGELTGINIDKTGIISAQYSNGQTKNAGQVVLSTFRNPQGLQPLGGNAWAASFASGDPIIGAPGQGNIGALQSGALEESNVDLTAELVNMIVAQRAYQANAQTIKTEDQVMQTLVNLR